MKNAAQREMYDETSDTSFEAPLTGAQTAAVLRQLAVERLAAHRSRRAALEPVASETAVMPPPLRSEAAERARAAVAARYQQTPSFQELLARDVVSGVEVHNTGVSPLRPTAFGREDRDLTLIHEQMSAATVEEIVAVLPTSQNRDMGHPVSVAVPVRLEVRPFEALALPAEVVVVPHTDHHDAEELAELNEEIEFRMTPEFGDHLLEPLPIQANIIEFPRLLVAAKKTRPRLAEGPLRLEEEGAAEMESAAAVEPEFQMRIFEVEEAEVEEAEVEEAEVAAVEVVPPTSQNLDPSTSLRTGLGQPAIELGHPASVVVVEETPVFLTEADATALESPDWQRLVLEGAEEEDEAPSWKSAAEVAKEEAAARADAAARPQISPARLELRGMGMTVDAICIAAGFVMFVCAAALLSGARFAALGPLHRTMLEKTALGAVLGAVVATLIVLYQALFFLLGKETPGMAYANLEFRGVGGEAPSRRSMARRLWANWMAVVPLGLGLLWALVDGERLGWNDRISGVYLREF